MPEHGAFDEIHEEREGHRPHERGSDDDRGKRRHGEPPVRLESLSDGAATPFSSPASMICRQLQEASSHHEDQSARAVTSLLAFRELHEPGLAAERLPALEGARRETTVSMRPSTRVASSS